MLTFEGVVFALVPMALFLFALYWVVRAAVAAAIRSTLPEAAQRNRRGPGI